MKTTSLTIRKAEPADLDAVEELREEAVSWLASKGHDQWQPGQPRVPTREGTADSISRGVTYLAYNQDDDLVGTITVDDHADPDFWTPSEQAEPALYIHRMIVRRAAAGAGVGRRLLDWASDEAARTGHRWLRLDAWKTNSPLHSLYERHGFTHLRTVDLPHRGSGALFQRSTT